MCCNFSHEKASGRRGDFIARWCHRHKWCWIKRQIVLLMSTITCCIAMAICVVI
jgi:hypothetical protein